MQKLDIQQVPKLKPDPMFKGMKKALKNPRCFDEVEKQLQEILVTSHKHKSAGSYAKCKECTERFTQRKKLMRKLGFKSILQYMSWKKIMTIIKAKKDFQL